MRHKTARIFLLRNHMKAIVTGGLGFIGSNFICHVHDIHPAWQILNIDKRTYAGNPTNVASVKSMPRYHWYKVAAHFAQRILPVVAEEFNPVWDTYTALCAIRNVLKMQQGWVNFRCNFTGKALVQ